MTKVTPQEFEALADRIERAPKIKNREICFTRSDAGYESICRAFYPDHLSMIVQSLRFAARVGEQQCKYRGKPRPSDPQTITCEEMDAIEQAAIAGKPLTCSQPEAVMIDEIESEIVKWAPGLGWRSNRSLLEDIARAILSRFDVRKKS